MTNNLYPPTRPQTVGEILDTAFRIFGTTLIKCLPYAFVAVILGQLPTLYTVASGRALVRTAFWTQQGRDPLWWLLELLAIFGTMTLTNAVLLRQYALAAGRPVSTATELATGARRVPGMLLIGILVMLAVVATAIPLGIIAAVILGVGGLAGSSSGAIWAGVMACVLVLVAGSWAVVRWICSGPLYLLTDRGPVTSMRYSWELTSGNFGRLSLIYTVGAVLIVVFYALSGAIGVVAASSLAYGDVAVVTAATAANVALLGALIAPFYSALTLAVLGDLSVRKEGTDLAQRLAAPPGG
jgi:hypothetical protein